MDTSKKHMGKIEGFKYLVEIIIWGDIELEHFGFAAKGLKPNSLPYSTREEAAREARRFINQLKKEARSNGTNTIDANCIFS